MTDESQSLIEKNLSWLGEHHPQLLDMINGYSPMSELVDEGDGWHNINFSGQMLYKPSAKEYIEDQLDGYFENPYTINFSALQPEHFDRFAGTFINGFIENLANDDITLHTYSQRKSAFYLLAFGLGTGQHLDRLIEESNCKVLVIIEPNIDFLYHALHVTDFDEMHQRLSARKGGLSLIVGHEAKQPDRIFDQMRLVIRFTNPCSVDGSMFMFHYGNDVFVATRDRLVNSVNVLTSGLGFYFDEVVMQMNTYENFRGGTAKMISYSPESVRKLPAFIIGSGPSLDKSIEVVKANKDKAVIFSSGTALRPLIKAGIRPDFHIEIENNVNIFRIMTALTEDGEDISDLHLLATTTIDPRVKDFFGDTSYYFRPGLSSFPIFKRDKDLPLAHGDPTVTNASLALAQQFGFREFYLFGVDLGARKGTMLHSKNAWQNTKHGKESPVPWNNVAPGNFGGEVVASADLKWSREEIEMGIKYFSRGRVYYNCSDGAQIKHTVAKHPRSVKIPDPDPKKADVVEILAGNYTTYTEIDLAAHWNDDTMMEMANQLCDDMVEAVRDTDNVKDKTYLARVNEILQSKESGQRLGLDMTFRGTLWQGLIGAEYYLNRIAEKDYDAAIAIFQDRYVDLIEELRGMYERDLGNLSKQTWRVRDRWEGLFRPKELTEEEEKMSADTTPPAS